MNTNTHTKTFDGTGLDGWVLPRGTFFKILSTSAVVVVEAMEGGSRLGYFNGISQGDGWTSTDQDEKLSPFDSLRVTSATAQTVKIIVGYGRFSSDAAAGSVTATITGTPTVIATRPATIGFARATVGAASATLSGAVATKWRSVCKNISATETAYINKEGVAATVANGYPVGPGEEFICYGNVGVSAIRGGGADIPFSIFEEHN